VNCFGDHDAVVSQKLALSSHCQEMLLSVGRLLCIREESEDELRTSQLAQARSCCHELLAPPEMQRKSVLGVSHGVASSSEFNPLTACPSCCKRSAALSNEFGL